MYKKELEIGYNLIIILKSTSVKLKTYYHMKYIARYFGAPKYTGVTYIRNKTR